MFSIWSSQLVDQSKLEVFADDKITVTKQLKFVLRRVNKKHLGKRRKCWLAAFSPFPTMFSKAFFLGVIKSQECVVKSYIHEL